ncbi:hypothetical protein LTR62_004959 [Meristemomyces frigidus]|uniref:Sm domain-containing protein n=1 Tax=Meristemomyces frigidus TaxID=1508187 RepID=A0AAN7YK64_9PEZI|nr:hypothetical protein LTR62_004959 [Meristemomyces frigidus]
MLFFSFFKTLVNHEVTVELKNDISIRGTLKSVDQYLNIKLDDISVVEELKYPHLSSVKNVFIRGSVVRYVHLPAAAVDTPLLEDATRRVDIYLTLANSTVTQTAFTLAPGLAYLAGIEGTGNSIGITLTPADYWNADAKKASLGTSTTGGTLYWDLGGTNAEIGGPVGSVNVTSEGTKADICGSCEGWNSGVKGCADDGVKLTMNLCSVNP